MPEEAQSVEPHQPPPVAPKSSSWKGLVFGIVGVIAIIIGVSKLTSGLGEMFGAANEAAVKLETESNEAAQRAFEASKEADIQLNELLGVLTAESLENFRAEHGQAIDQAVEKHRTTVDSFRVAADKLDELLELEFSPTIEEYFSFKTKMYRKYAEGYDHRRTAVSAMQDAAITDKAALLATINELAPLADAAIDEGTALAPKLDEVAKELSVQK